MFHVRDKSSMVNLLSQPTIQDATYVQTAAQAGTKSTKIPRRKDKVIAGRQLPNYQWIEAMQKD
jgi:hypothetical protein